MFVLFRKQVSDALPRHRFLAVGALSFPATGSQAPRAVRYSGGWYVGSAISYMSALESGDSVSAHTLFNALYSELHGLAKRELARRGGLSTLGVTTLLHEAYLDISARDRASFPDQARFMGYAAQVMRGIIIDYVRTRMALKRGGQFEITSMEGDLFANPVEAKQLSSISDALDHLAKVEPELAEVVDLKFFCGFTFAEIASMQRLSERTVQRRWEKARIYLHCCICADLSL
jgi:RNA polymerase sigma factor (TIGR02999 family)